jgi:hypothetical protein
MRLFPLFFAAFLSLPLIARAQTPSTAPSTEPSADADLHKTDLVGPVFTSHAHGIEFRPPLNCVKVDKAQPDSIVEFDRADYDWRLNVWTVNLQQSLPLSIHKDQYGATQDGVMEITLARIKQQTPNAEVVRNELINVGKIRVGMIAVRYETATHERRFTQQAIIEPPDADDRLYYFFDLTGPGKPQYEADDVINPAEKLAFDTFAEVIDSIRLLDRSSIVEYQRQALYDTRELFVLWGGEHSLLVKSGLVAEQYQRIIKDDQDVGYQHITEEFQPNMKDSTASMVKVAVRTWMSPTPLQQWNTNTVMFSSADLKHEHWETTSQCTDARGKIIDTLSQIGASDQATEAVQLQPKENPGGSLLPQEPRDRDDEFGGPLGQGNVDLEIRRSLEVRTTHRGVELNPFRIETPPFYIPQAFSFILPNILPLKPKTYMFATFVPNSPQNTSANNLGNVMARYVEVLPIQQVNFRGQTFDAAPITDKITLEGPVTTYYLGLDGKFVGSTTTYTDGDKSTTVEVIPSDSQTIEHIWSHPDLSAPAEPAADGGGDYVLPHEPQ